MTDLLNLKYGVKKANLIFYSYLFLIKNQVV